MEKSMKIEGMMCGHCEARVKKEKEIANEPIVLMKIREKLKLEKIKTDFE